jgi:hypothetical protein
MALLCSKAILMYVMGSCLTAFLPDVKLNPVNESQMAYKRGSGLSVDSEHYVSALYAPSPLSPAAHADKIAPNWGGKTQMSHFYVFRTFLARTSTWFGSVACLF